MHNSESLWPESKTPSPLTLLSIFTVPDRNRIISKNHIRTQVYLFRFRIGFAVISGVEIQFDNDYLKFFIKTMLRVWFKTIKKKFKSV